MTALISVAFKDEEVFLFLLMREKEGQGEALRKPEISLDYRTAFYLFSFTRPERL